MHCLISISETKEATAKQRFYSINLITNDYRSSMYVSTFDATMWIYYHGETLSDKEADNNRSVWERRENRGIELQLRWINI